MSVVPYDLINSGAGEAYIHHNLIANCIAIVSGPSTPQSPTDEDPLPNEDNTLLQNKSENALSNELVSIKVTNEKGQTTKARLDR